MKICFSKYKITPIKNCYLDGFGFRQDPSDGVLSEIYVRTCVFCTDKNKHAIVQYDLIGFSKDVYELLISQIELFTPFRKNEVSLTCIHTHSAPTCGLLKELPIDLDYIAYVGECSAKALNEAYSNIEETTIKNNIVQDGLHYCENRRGRNVIDRSVRMISFVNSKDEIIGGICRASCHPTINRTNKISSDYVDIINSYTYPIIFLQGTAGDIKPVFSTQKEMQNDLDNLKQDLKNAIDGNLINARETYANTIHSKLENIVFPMEDYKSIDFYKKELECHSSHYSSYEYPCIEKHLSFRKMQWLKMMINRIENNIPSKITAPIQFLNISEVVFVFIPFEVLTLTGKKIESILLNKGFSKENIFIISCSNITSGYLIPEEEFEYGGYEVESSNEWYLVPKFSMETEKTLLNWIDDNIEHN